MEWTYTGQGRCGRVAFEHSHAVLYQLHPRRTNASCSFTREQMSLEGNSRPPHRYDQKAYPDIIHVPPPYIDSEAC